MKYRNEAAKKLALVGAGAGLVMFALFGLLQGSVIGGAIGLDIVNSIYDPGASPTLMARAIIGASMLAGVLVSGIVFVTGCASVMAAVGYMAGYLAEPKQAGEYEKTTTTR
jgi:hypothetical protein